MVSAFTDTLLSVMSDNIFPTKSLPLMIMMLLGLLPKLSVPSKGIIGFIIVGSPAVDRKRVGF